MIIDVSQHQGIIDWKAVKANNQGITGVYIKATEGVGFLDANFHANVAGAKAVNLDVGFYHFASLNSNDVLTDSAAEAKAFYNATKKYTVQLPHVLDIETNKIGIKPADVLKYIQNFVLTMHIFGVNDVVLYSYTPFLNTNLPKDHKLADSMRLWIAAYTPTLKLPNGYTKAWLWQYTSTGTVAGIKGKVDLNKIL